MWMQSIGETATTLTEKTNPAPNATIIKSQGTLKKIVGKNGKVNGNQSASTQSLRKPNNANAKKCTYWGMKNHTTDKCFRLIANQMKIEKAKTNPKVNKVEQDGECDHRSTTNLMLHYITK